MTNDEEIEQAERESAFAQMGLQVVNNEAYKQAFIARKAQIFDMFCSTKRDQVEDREEAWRTMVNLNTLEQYFNQLLTTGKMADKALESLQETTKQD